MRPSRGRGHDVLHLHRLERGHAVARLHRVAGPDVDADDEARHRGLQRGVDPGRPAARGPRLAGREVRRRREAERDAPAVDRDERRVLVPGARTPRTASSPCHARRSSSIVRATVDPPASATSRTRCAAFSRQPPPQAPGLPRCASSRAAACHAPSAGSGVVVAASIAAGSRLDRGRPGSAVPDDRQPHEPPQEGEVGREPEDLGGVERRRQPGQGRRAIGAGGDDLREQRVEPPADHVAGLDARRRRASRRRPPGRTPSRRPGHASATIRPADGRNPFAGSSALSRASIAWPPVASAASIAACSRPSCASVAPLAIPSWSATRSRRRTSSVTGCSTWSRALSSRKTHCPSAPDEELAGPGVLVAARRSRAARRRPTAPAGAASSRPGAGASSITFW